MVEKLPELQNDLSSENIIKRNYRYRNDMQLKVFYRNIWTWNFEYYPLQ